MPSIRLHRWMHLVRVCVFALCALGLALQPVASAAAELHELKHDPSGGHAHVIHAGDPAAELAAADESDRGAGILHTLLHFSHCSGVDLAVLPVVQTPAAGPLGGHPVVAHAVTPAKMRLPAPFKPPIAA